MTRVTDCPVWGQERQAEHKSAPHRLLTPHFHCSGCRSHLDQAANHHEEADAALMGTAPGTFSVSRTALGCSRRRQSICPWHPVVFRFPSMTKSPNGVLWQKREITNWGFLSQPSDNRTVGSSPDLWNKNLHLNSISKPCSASKLKRCWLLSPRPGAEVSKLFESQTTTFNKVSICKLHTCATALVYYIHDKPYIKIDLLKEGLKIKNKNYNFLQVPKVIP